MEPVVTPSVFAATGTPAPLGVAAPVQRPAFWSRAATFGHDLLILTKYRITMMALFTGYTAMVVQGDSAYRIGAVVPLLLALFLTGGAANTLNQLFELKKDAVMDRTKARRPLPAGRISPRAAVIFAVTQFVVAQAILLGVFHSPLAAGLSLLTILYYSFFYTLWLKPRHWLNIVVGGVPGAMGPLIAWAAVAHEIGAAPLAMSAVIFLWTPPHVWALAIRLKDDYARAGIPMLPVVKGIDETTRQIFIYTVVLVAGTLAMPFLWEGFVRNGAYAMLAVVLGAVFLVWTAVLWMRRPVLPTMPLFRFSILYIGALFLGLVVDAWRLK